MKNVRLEQFRQMLERYRDETVRSLTRIQQEGRGSQDDCPLDMGERSVTTFSRELLFQQNSQRRQLLRQVDAALDRIRKGTYGNCAGCEDEISAKRLEAMPFTSYCRDCQEVLERQLAAERERA